MAQVMKIPPKKSKVSQLLELGGTIAGGIIGGTAAGPGGAAVGGAVGGSVIGHSAGGIAVNILEPPKQEIGVEKQSTATALMRRQQQLAQDNLAVLNEAEQNLAYLPENLRQQYAPAIMQARYLEQQKRGLV